MKKSYEDLKKENEELIEYIEELEERISACQYQNALLEEKLRGVRG